MATLDLFELRTARDTWLAVQADEVVMAEAPDPADMLILAVPRGAPQTCLLVAADGRMFGVEGDGMTAPAISCRLRRVPGGQAELRHPLAGRRFLGIVTGAPVGKPRRVLFDRVGDKVLDRFRLQPIDQVLLFGDARALLDEIGAATRAPMGADTLMGLLQAGSVRASLAEPLIRLLPPDALADLARRLLARPADLALIRRAIPHDPWLSDTLPALAAWLAQRPATRRLDLPAAADHVSVLQSGELRPQAGLALIAQARRTVAPRRLATLLTIVRNEGPYILDWLAHHRACGFDHAVIYSNDNDDGSDALLGLLADHGEITWVRNTLSPTARAQWKAHGHAFKALPDLLDYRWTMVLDLDEYIGFRTDLFGSIGELIGWHEFQQVDGLALRWLNYAAGRLDQWHDAPSTRRFLRREPEVSPMFKSLMRSNMVWDAHAHFPHPTLDTPFAYRLEDGAPCHHLNILKGIKGPADAVTADSAWVSHHIFRSAGEALMKIARGDCLWSAARPEGDERTDMIVRRFVAMADNPRLVTDDRTLLAARGLDAQLARLHALPGVQACDAAIKQGFAVRLAELTRTFIESDVATGKPPCYAQLQAILRHQAAQPRGRAEAA